MCSYHFHLAEYSKLMPVKAGKEETLGALQIGMGCLEVMWSIHRLCLILHIKKWGSLNIETTRANNYSNVTD